jgi:phosphonoacetaldehyde hydrolase
MGRVLGVVFDWAGTLVDHGSLAPTVALIDGFKAFGVTITMDEARQPMGRHKRDHIREILHMPQVIDRWSAAHGRRPDESDVERLFADFIPRQTAVIAQFSDPIPGVQAMLVGLRERGIGVGSCTGYTRVMMDVLLPAAQSRCPELPELVVTPDEVPEGRPAPWMCFVNAMRLGLYPMSALVKVGDTPVDMTEGRNAGMWTVGVTLSGNELGLKWNELWSLDAAQLQPRREHAESRLRDAGAHDVIDSAAELLPVIDELERRIERGERP